MAAPRPRSVKTSDLKSKVLNVAQTSVYQVRLQPPTEVVSYLNSGSRQFNYAFDGEDVELMCDSTQLPGSSFMTHEVTNDYRGVTEEMAYRRSYDGKISFSFYVNQKYDVVEMFDGWMDYISGYDENQSRMKTPYASYRMKYPEDYKSDVYVTKFEKNVDSRVRNNNQELGMEYTFVGAFPISCQPMSVSYDSSQVLKYQVTMSYIRYVRQRKTV